jgi:hypothetical protein
MMLKMQNFGSVTEVLVANGLLKDVSTATDMYTAVRELLQAAISNQLVTSQRKVACQRVTNRVH